MKCVENAIIGISENGKNLSNLSKNELEALNDLKNDKSIVIKSADKGSAVVVWDREDYCKEAERQLSDPEVYEKLDYDPTEQLSNDIEECLDKVKTRGDLDAQTLEYFKVDNTKLGRFYLQAKINKTFENVPGRPLISNSGYFTENISTFLDHHLQPLAQGVKSYIKDTTDFLNKLKNIPNLPKNSIFCAIDVVGLYPNIPHELGLKAMQKALDKREDQSVSTQTLLDLAEFVLKNNFFTHNDQIFKQIRGTAMGTFFAPSYAILALAELEEEAISKYKLQPWVWWRFIDDIFTIWQHGRMELDSFSNI